jgi:transposase
MANRIKMAIETAIKVLRKQGWSKRRIARELGIHRDTVRRYLDNEEKDSKPATLTTGTDSSANVDSYGLAPSSTHNGTPSKCTTPTTGIDSELVKVTAGNSGPFSKCHPYRNIIKQKLEAGLTAQRIFQDLCDEYTFTASYESVKRYVRRLENSTPLPFRRIESCPGEECQVDFGRGAPVVTIEGKRRHTHVFRMVLSHSRKGYSEAVYRQTTESFIRCLENAFNHFGGVPRTLVIDNLKAAVTRADWFDPDLNPKIETFCSYYGTVILPTKPSIPRHKGKIEKGIEYVKSNALKARTFTSLQEQNQFLLDWETRVADMRIHGTTRKQVQKIFEEVEKSALLPLPPMHFAFFHEGQRSVHRDGHVEVDKAYYSVPPEYVGRKVWVRWDSRLVKILNNRFEKIAVHTKKETGRFSTNPGHIASEKIAIVELGASVLLKRASMIGTHARAWSMSMIKNRGIQGIRVLQGFLSLAGKHRCGDINKACKSALEYGAFRLKDLKFLLNKTETQTQFEFTQQHQVIRDMSEYGKLVKVSFQQSETTITPESNPFTVSMNKPTLSEPYRRNRIFLKDEEEEL